MLFLKNLAFPDFGVFSFFEFSLWNEILEFGLGLNPARTRKRELPLAYMHCFDHITT